MSLSLPESYQALTTGVGAVELSRDFVSVSGPQALEYLQGQLSQDLDALAPGRSALSLLLEPQGKISAFLRLTRTGPDSVVLDFDAGHGPAVLDRLRRFKLRTKADIDLIEGWRCLALRGPLAPSPDSTEDLGGPGTLRARFDWPGLAGTDLLGPSPEAPSGIELCDGAAYQAARIEAGLPALGAELDERTIPEETGLVPATVSFTKGCYTGQELVARIDSRGGNVARRLRGVVASSGGDLQVGAAVVVDGKEVGRLTSVAVSPERGPVALAYIKRGHEPPVRARVGEGEVTVVALPMAGDARS